MVKDILTFKGNKFHLCDIKGYYIKNEFILIEEINTLAFIKRFKKSYKEYLLDNEKNNSKIKWKYFLGPSEDKDFVSKTGYSHVSDSGTYSKYTEKPFLYIIFKNNKYKQIGNLRKPEPLIFLDELKKNAVESLNTENFDTNFFNEVFNPKSNDIFEAFSLCYNNNKTLLLSILISFFILSYILLLTFELEVALILMFLFDLVINILISSNYGLKINFFKIYEIFLITVFSVAGAYFVVNYFILL